MWLALSDMVASSGAGTGPGRFPHSSALQRSASPGSQTPFGNTCPRNSVSLLSWAGPKRSFGEAGSQTEFGNQETRKRPGGTRRPGGRAWPIVSGEAAPGKAVSFQRVEHPFHLVAGVPVALLGGPVHALAENLL